MKIVLALIAVLVVFATTGCGGPAERPSVKTVTPTSSSIDVTTGVTLEVSIGSSSYPAGTEQTATVTLRNDSSKEVIIGDIWALRILDVGGKVFSDPAARAIYPSVQIALPPKGTKTKHLTFEVPAQGAYELQAYLSTAQLGGSKPIPFESVAPQ